LEQEIRKLGKTQYKANMLAERQAQRVEQTLESLTEQQDQREVLVEQVVAERVAAARDTWLASILPTLDGLDHAIESGRRYLARRDQAAKHPNLSEAQRALVSPADRNMLASWLEGLRLVRERLLALLKSQGVTPIPTVGQPFDPYQHVAVATTAEGADRPGTIVAEERRGYRTEDRVLRYADVVVYRPEKIPEP
jgi:molecular chaperone GrpE